MNQRKTIQLLSYSVLFVFYFLFLNSSIAQGHNFSVFDPGIIDSSTPGVSTSLSVSSLSGPYLTYVISMDFTGSGNAQTAWSSTIHIELNNGSGVNLVEGRRADMGSMDNGNSATLSWTGIMERQYIGGTTLNARVYDDYNDASGPYFCTISNVQITIYAADNVHAFSSYSTGNIESNTSGVTTAMNTASLTGNYLLYSVTADWQGDGTAQTAWSNSIELEILSGTTILKPSSTAQVGSMSNANPTTLHWTGIFNTEYEGGMPLSTRFWDNYHDGSGPYNSSLSNIQFEIYEAILATDYPTYSPGNITSGTTGTTTSVDVSGVSENQLFYLLSADWQGSGTAQTAWSNSIQLEINDGASTIYKPLSFAQIGSMPNPNPTTLFWSGVFTEEYVGGTTLNTRFFDDYHDPSGPYLSTVSNVQLRTYPAANASVPVELISFDAKLIDREVVLEWKAASEYGNAFYTVEKSLDGKKWQELGSLPNQDDRSTINHYSLTDNKPSVGDNYYRLKQTDFDGSFSYSKIVMIDFQDSRIAIYPNPVSDVITVENDEEQYSLFIYNSMGQKIYSNSFSHSLAKIDMSTFPAGIYQMVIDNSFRKTLIKE